MPDKRTILYSEHAAGPLQDAVLRVLRSGAASQALSEQYGLSPIPPGAVTAWAGDYTKTELLPPGWLPCDGRAVDRKTYAALFRAIGIAYGAGDGNSTFNLPDLRGRMVLGEGQNPAPGYTNRALAVTGGEESHQLTTAELPVHTHTATQPAHSHAPSGNTYFLLGGGLLVNATAGAVVYQTNTLSTATGTATPAITVGNTGSGSYHNNMPPYLVLSYLIKW